ncbi:MAG TPA: magnesium and cobalt transport protein CorA [Glycomyces sp.]|nr:magnesium and cobalt transport protein CorA [Glycomyces sp.]
MIDYSVVGHDGAERRNGATGDLLAAVEDAPENGFVWVSFDAPAARDLAAVLSALGLDRFGVDPEDAVHRRPKVEVVDDAVMLLVKTVWYLDATRQVETGDLTVYTDGRSLVTVRRGDIDPAAAVRERLDTDAALRTTGAAGTVHALLDAIIARYNGVIEDLTDDVSELERHVFSGQRTDHNEEIYVLIRETLEFQNAVRPLVPFAHLLKERRGAPELLRWKRFGEIGGHLLRVDAAVETCMSLLTTVLTAHQGQIGTWQNEDTKKISAWAAIGLVPTVIVGVYGMNFDYMPELHWKVGYPLVMVFMAGVCLLLYRGFKRNGWLLAVDAFAPLRTPVFA